MKMALTQSRGPRGAVPLGGADREAARRRMVLTPEGITLPLVLATRGARLGALVLDLFFIFMAMLAISLAVIYTAGDLFVDRTHGGVAGQALQFLGIVWLAAMFLLRNAWFGFFELGPRGATPGKRITGIRIVARDGGRLSAEMVIARNLLRDIELFVPLALIGALGGNDGYALPIIFAAAWFLIFAGIPLFNADRLRAGDLIAGTWVVEAPRQRLDRAMSAQAGAASGYRFAPADLAVYGEYELQTLERVLRTGQTEAMVEVARAICTRIHWTAPGDNEVRGFLDAYYTQLRARLETGMRFGRRKKDKFAAAAKSGG